MKRLTTTAVALTLVATSCTSGDVETTSEPDPAVSTSQVSLPTTPPSTTTTTVAIVSPLAPPTGEVIAIGVGSDAYVQWSDGTQSCVAVDVVIDDNASAVALSEVLQTWAVERAIATVDLAGASISVRSCTS